MGTSSPDIRDIQVPQEDGAIQEAFADLDRKLSVHAGAVRDAEARLRETARHHQEPTSQPIESAPEETPPPPQPNVVRVPLQRLRDVPIQPAVEKAAPQEPPPKAPASDDDETLLASLDQATSKAIRVMRRLNPNRSVQDLLAQIEKQKDSTGPAAKPASKSWFRRR